MLRKAREPPCHRQAAGDVAGPVASQVKEVQREHDRRDEPAPAACQRPRAKMNYVRGAQARGAPDTEVDVRKKEGML